MISTSNSQQDTKYKSMLFAYLLYLISYNSFISSAFYACFYVSVSFFCGWPFYGVFFFFRKAWFNEIYKFIIDYYSFVSFFCSSCKYVSNSILKAESAAKVRYFFRLTISCFIFPFDLYAWARSK